MPSSEHPSEALIRKLAEADRVVVVTGAGVSAQSGIPTFRDPGGLWDKFRPEELANVDAFLRNPGLVQAWYRYRRDLIESRQPNPAHFAIAELESMYDSFTLATQNVDGLHQRAGSSNVLELHGNILRRYCIECGAVPESNITGVSGDEVERCTVCGGLIRPDVVWFGEALPPEVIEAAFEAAEQAEVLLSVGTSGIVYPAAGLPGTARNAGAYTAEFNIEASALAAEMDEVVIGPAGSSLPNLVEAVRTQRSR